MGGTVCKNASDCPVAAKLAGACGASFEEAPEDRPRLQRGAAGGTLHSVSWLLCRTAGGGHGEVGAAAMSFSTFCKCSDS
jgi:hypothetical protein